MKRHTAAILIAAAAIASQAATARTGTQSRDAMDPAELPRIFAAIDRNRDGHLDRAEVTAFGVSQHMGVTLREKAWRSMDPDRDGRVTLAEFTAAAMAYKADHGAPGPAKR